MDQHCSEETLSAYLDGDLASEEAGTTAEHLAECEVCRQSLAQVRDVRDAATAMEQLVPPDRVWNAIRGRIADDRTRGLHLARLFWIGAPALAAALLLVALAGWLGPSARGTVRSIAHIGRGQTPGAVAAAMEPSDDSAAEETAREYGEYVRGIDRAIDECRTALAENPGNSRVRAAYDGASSDRQRAVDRLASWGE